MSKLRILYLEDAKYDLDIIPEHLEQAKIDFHLIHAENKEEYIYCPSVDALFLSVSETYPGRTLGLVLTGMGHDGLDGTRELKKSGARIFAQDEDTCVVFGMPKAVVEADLVDKVLPLERIAGEVLNSV